MNTTLTLVNIWYIIKRKLLARVLPEASYNTLKSQESFFFSLNAHCSDYNPKHSNKEVTYNKRLSQTGLGVAKDLKR